MKPIRLFYGRRSSNMSSELKAYINKGMPNYLVSKEDFIDDKFRSLVSDFDIINLEIGFGSGDFIYNSSMHNPNTFYLGVEAYLDGILRLFKTIDANVVKPQNIAVYNNNLYDIIDYLPKNFFSNIYILFPDPWPKKRHNKRRIINKDNLDLFSSILKQNGKLRFVSDHVEYRDYVANFFLALDDFQLILDSFSAPADHFSTKYERKAGKENKSIRYLEYLKK